MVDHRGAGGLGAAGAGAGGYSAFAGGGGCFSGLRADGQGGFWLDLCLYRNADPRHAAYFYRAGGGAGLSRQAVEYRGRGAALPGRDGRGGRWHRADRCAILGADSDHFIHRRGGGGFGHGRAGLPQNPLWCRRGGDHAFAQFHHPDLCADDAGRPVKRPDGHGLAAIRTDCR